MKITLARLAAGKQHTTLRLSTSLVMKIAPLLKFHIILGLALTFSLQLPGQAVEKEPAELSELREKWQGATKSRIAPITKSYLERLEQLKIRFTKQERFVEALHVKKEIEITSNPEAPQPEKSNYAPPRDLVLLQTSYLKEREAVESKTNQIYLEALQKLQKEASRAGKLSEALAYRKEAQKFAPKPDKEEELDLLPKTKKELKDWLIGTKWAPVGNEKSIFIFSKNGRFSSLEFQPSFKVITPRSILVEWSNNIKIVCEFDDKLTTLSETGRATNVFKRVMD